MLTLNSKYMYVQNMYVSGAQLVIRLFNKKRK